MPRQGKTMTRQWQDNDKVKNTRETTQTQTAPHGNNTQHIHYTIQKQYDEEKEKTRQDEKNETKQE
jgi:hypothetical protein